DVSVPGGFCRCGYTRFLWSGIEPQEGLASCPGSDIVNPDELVVDPDGTSKTDSAGTSRNGCPLEPGAPFDPGDPGIVSRTRPAGLFDRPNHRLPAGREGSRAEVAKDRECAHFRRGDLARAGGEPPRRRPVEPVRWEPATGHGANGRDGEAHTPGHPR